MVCFSQFLPLLQPLSAFPKHLRWLLASQPQLSPDDYNSIFQA